MELEIRRALPEEAEALTKVALAAKSYWDYPERWMQIWTPQLTFDAAYFEKYESWTASVDHQLVGFYTLQEREGNARLENLWIIPAQMGRGIGSLLFKHALRLAKKKGYRILRLESDPNAVGFYQKMGAHQVGENHSEADGQPRNLPIMEIEL